jgi:hypothetical protein
MTTRKEDIDGFLESADVPPEAVAAIKLTRADAVKLVAGEMIELAAHDVAACSDHVIYCRDLFREHVIELAAKKYYQELTAIGLPIHHNVAGMCKTTTYRVYEARRPK